METICCFGASVTQQKEGYPVFLKEYLKDYNIISYGYGSHSLQNAGIIYIDKIVSLKPQYCILDFFVVGSQDYLTDIECLKCIIYKLSTINCKCIIPFFLCINENNSSDNYYYKIKEFLNLYNIYYIDFKYLLNFSNELIKDNVHTTIKGAQKYAEILSSLFIKNNNKLIIPHIIINNNEFLNIYKYNCLNNLCINENESIIINLDNNYKYLFLVLTIGLHSGIININDVEYNTWDIYCHYDRTVTRKYIINSNKVTIYQTNKNFDKSGCRRKIDFESQQKLIIKEIYYC